MQQSNHPDVFTRAAQAGTIDNLAKQLLTDLAAYELPPQLQAIGLRIESISSQMSGGPHVQPDDGPTRLRITAHHISWISEASHAWLRGKNTATRLGGRLVFFREGERDHPQVCAELWFDHQGNVQLHGFELHKRIGQDSAVICEWVVVAILKATHQCLPQCESFY